MRNGDYNDDSAVTFVFRTATNPQQPTAARIYYEDNGQTLDNVFPGTQFRRRSMEELSLAYKNSLRDHDQLAGADLEAHGFVTIDFVVDDAMGNLTVKLPNGKEVPANDNAAFHNAIQSGMTNTMMIPDGLNFFGSNPRSILAPVYARPQNMSEAETESDGTFRISVNGTEGFNMSDKTATHCQPIEGSLDILAIGTDYIRGSTSSNGTSNGTTLNETSSTHQPSHRGAHERFKHRRQTTKVEGPIQCGPGQPCLDGSCCK